jgi:hypothetical protein
MPQSMPDAATLITAAARYLETELMPTLQGYHRFQTRVTVNVLNTIQRELKLRESNLQAERGRLEMILGRSGDPSELSVELCGRIRNGQISIEDPALREHVRRSLAEALAINNPRWIERSR